MNDQMLSICEREDFWIIYDRNAPVPDFWTKPVVVILTSPNRERYKEYEKEQAPRTIVMPMWKLRELKELNVVAADQLTDDHLLQRYKVAGGVPRNIFKTHYEWEEYSEALSSVCHDERYSGLGENGVALFDINTMYHRLFAISVLEDGHFQTVVPRFISYFVRSEISAANEARTRRTIGTIMEKERKTNPHDHLLEKYRIFRERED